jgi:hypothetical protein
MNVQVRPIGSKRDHDAALKEVGRLWGAKAGTSEGDRLNVLVAAIRENDRKSHTMPNVPHAAAVSEIASSSSHHDRLGVKGTEAAGRLSAAVSIPDHLLRRSTPLLSCQIVS